MRVKENERLIRIMTYFPSRLQRELVGLINSSRMSFSEVCLRNDGISTVSCERGTLPLYCRLREGELAEVLREICHGSLYAYRDAIACGYIPLSLGVRVGIVGEARYEEGRIVGVDAVSALIFRIPTGKCDFSEKLYRYWLTSGGGSTLIIAPPAGGKTTALRSLAKLIGFGRDARHAVVVDERCEFDPDDYKGARVDILRAYRRERGIELAVRTMSAEVILVDEIATEADARALRNAVGVGIPVIATTHGEGIRGVSAREHIRSLIEDGCFKLAISIRREGGGFFVSEPEELRI